MVLAPMKIFLPLTSTCSAKGYTYIFHSFGILDSSVVVRVDYIIVITIITIIIISIIVVIIHVNQVQEEEKQACKVRPSKVPGMAI